MILHWRRIILEDRGEPRGQWRTSKRIIFEACAPTLSLHSNLIRNLSSPVTDRPMYRFPFGVPAQPYPLAVSKLETNFSNEAFSFLSLSLSFHPLIPFLPKRSIPGRSCAIGCLEWSEFQANFSRLIRMVNWNRLSSLQRVVVIVE